jgi:hypothetical protein
MRPLTEGHSCAFEMSPCSILAYVASRTPDVIITIPNFPSIDLAAKKLIGPRDRLIITSVAVCREGRDKRAPGMDRKLFRVAVSLAVYCRGSPTYRLTGSAVRGYSTHRVGTSSGPSQNVSPGQSDETRTNRGMNSTIFCNVTPYSPVETYQTFGGTYCFCLQGR